MDSQKFLLENGTAVAIGCFDGLHIGHKEVIQTAVNFAKKYSQKSVVFQIKRNSDLLLTSTETAEILCSWDVDEVVCRPLDAEFMNLSCDEFVKQYLCDFLNAKFVSVGYNFRFGKEAIGDVEMLKKLCNRCNIELCITPPVKVDGEIVSTTKLRKMLANGEDVLRYLGR